MKAAMKAVVAIALMAAVSGGASAKTRISVWQPWGDVNGEAFRKMVEAYNKSQDRVEVKAVAVSEPAIGQEKLMTAMAAGSPPDCALFADLLVAEYAIKNVLTPLDSYVKSSGFTSKDFWKPAWGVTFYEGRQWALPFTEDSRMLYFNKAVVRDVGYDPDRFPRTLEELEAMAAKMFKSDGQKYTRVGYVPWGGNWYFYGWGWLFGGDFWDAKAKRVTPNDSRNVEALEWLHRFSQRYDINKIGRSPQDLYRGTLGMVNDGNWLQGQIRKGAPKSFEYGVAPVPPPAGREKSTWSGVWTIIIPRGSKHPKDAWDFMGYACGPEGQAIFARNCAQYPANAVATRNIADDLERIFGPYTGAFTDMMDFSHHRPTMPVGSYMWDQMDKGMWEVLKERKAPRKALDDVASLVQKELEKVIGRSRNRK